MRARTATVLGFLAASVIPALQFVALAVASNESTALAEQALFALVTLLVYYPFSVFFTGVFGVPMYFLAKWLRLVTWWFAAASGALIGLLVSVIARSPNRTYLEDVAAFVPAATISAVVFWVIWRKGQHSAPKA